MKFISVFCASLLVAFCSSGSAAAEDGGQQQIEREVAAFFDGYLAVYNQRFGRPERSAQFRQELSEQVHMPFLQSPPMSAPRVPDSVETFTSSFEGFVSMLERKGVSRLQWERMEFQVLTANKVLASNIGVGVSEDGEIVYETASLYLLYRTEGGWKITMFSPYDVDKAVRLGPSVAATD